MQALNMRMLNKFFVLYFEFVTARHCPQKENRPDRTVPT